MYDVMATRAPAAARGGRRRVEPRAPPHDRRRGDRGAAAGAGRARARPRPTSSTTARPTTCAWCSPCSARPSASARCAATAWRSRAWWSATAAPPACSAATRWAAASSSSCGANVVNATGRVGRPAPSRRAARRGRGADASAPAAARTSRSPRTTLPVVAGAIVPAGSGRSIFVLPVARPHADRHDRQRLRGLGGPRAAGRGRTSSTCSTPRTSSSARSLTPGRPDRRLRRACAR